MAGGPELEITADLAEAFVRVLGAEPTEPEPVVVLAAYLDSVAKGYGLSGSLQLPDSQFERADPPSQALPLIDHFLAEGDAEFDEDCLRDRLYSVFVELSGDRSSRQILNRNEPLSDVGLLYLGQVYWNLEATGARPALPIKPGPITTYGKQLTADVPVPNANRDFATMKWAARCNERAPYKSSGQGFRKQGARLAVLAARRIVEDSAQPEPAVDGAMLRRTETDQGVPRVSSVAWPEVERVIKTRSAAPVARTAAASGPEGSVAADRPEWAEPERIDTRQVRVGRPADVGASYQRRGFDDKIDQLWSGGGDRRVWLRGGPGLGKSYSARRVMQEAIARRDDNRENLLIWVDSADPRSVCDRLSSAVDQMPGLGLSVSAEGPDRLERQARALLEAMATSRWRWLVVLDNADAASLIEAGLIPPGRNSNGRVLVTTLSQDHRITNHGRVVPAELFNREEAVAYVRAQRDPRSGGPALLARAPARDVAVLIEAVGYQPLALSIAVATIVTNDLDVADWIAEFDAAPRMDAAADAPDPGGYQSLIGATWQVALRRASRGVPDGVVERAAAVAAVLDPDGHPTWLWDSEPVAAWVAGDAAALARGHGGRPVAVQRLIDHGVVELVGGTWKHGRLAMHHLAARAVRELIDKRDLIKIAEILLDAFDASQRRWLVALEPTLGCTQQLLSIPGLSPAKRSIGLDIITAIRIVQDDWREAGRAAEESAAIAKTLGGSDGATDLRRRATRLQRLGLVLEAQQEPAEAKRRYAEARDACLRAVETGGVDDAEQAEIFDCLGQLQHKLGLTAEAETSRVRAAEIYQRVVADPETDDVELPGHLLRLGRIQTRLGHLADAEMNLAQAVRKAEQRVDADAGERDVFLWDALESLASVQEGQGRRQESLETRRQIVRTLERLLGVGASWANGPLVKALITLGSLLRFDPERRDEAEAYLVHAVERASPSDADAPDRHALDRAEALEALGLAQQDFRRLDEAVHNFADAVRIRESVAVLTPTTDPRGRAQWRELAWRLLNLGRVERERAQLAEAQTITIRAVEIARRLTEDDPGDLESEETLACGLHSLGDIQSDRERGDEAATSFSDSVGIFEYLLAAGPDEHRLLLCDGLLKLAKVLTKLGRPDEAAAALSRLHELVPDDGAEQ
jgi:tetratricopeptide (TPR) repeat protein